MRRVLTACFMIIAVALAAAGCSYHSYPAKRHAPVRHVTLTSDEQPVSEHFFCDTTTPAACPSWTYAVAAYINGWGGYSQARADFPHAYLIAIDARGDDPWVHGPEALDVEPGAAPASVINWWNHQRNLEGYPAVDYGAPLWDRNIMDHAGGTIFKVWLADPDSTPHYIPGTSATQYDWQPQYDLSYSAQGVQQTFGPLGSPAHHVVMHHPFVPRVYHLSADIQRTPPRWYTRCVEFRESTDGQGSPDLFGFLQQTWQELGFPGSPYTAPRWMQFRAFDKAYALWGVQPWRPSDGC